MSVSKDISLNVLASVQGYAKELGKIPGITEKEAAKAAKALGAQLAKAEVQALKGGTKATSSSISQIKGALQAAGVFVLAKGFKDAVEGAIELVRHADAVADSLARAGAITDQEAESVHEVKFALDAVTASFDALIAVAVSQFEPVVKRIAVDIIAVTLAAQDLVHWLGDDQGLLSTLLRLMPGMSMTVTHLEMIETALSAGGWIKRAEEEFDALGESVNKFQSKLPAFDALHRAQQAVLEADGAWTESTKKGSAALEARLQAMVKTHAFELQTARERIALMEAEKATDQELEAARTELHALEVKQLTEEGALTAAIEAAKRAERMKTQDLMLSTFDNILGASKTLAQGSIAVSATLNAVQIALSAAAAGWRILGEEGPWALPAAIATWIAGAASAGWAASQSFAGGATKHPIPNIGGGGSRRERRQERREERRSNREGDTVVVVQYRHRHFDDATDDAMRRNSPLSRLAQRNRNGNRSR